MTTQILFNQFAYTDRLTRDDAFSAAQARASAEALAAALSESVATQSQLDALRTELKADIATVRTEIAAAKNEILRWVLGFNLGLIAAVFAIAKYIH